MKFIRLLRMAALAAMLSGLASGAVPAASPVTPPRTEVERPHRGAELLHSHDLAGFKSRAGGTEIAV